MLRYDCSLKRGPLFYFWTTFLAYICGLVMTFVALNNWKHSQPALLYLVPACLGAPILMAAIRGDLSSMFSYADYSEEEEEGVEESNELGKSNHSGRSIFSSGNCRELFRTNKTKIQ